MPSPLHLVRPALSGAPVHGPGSPVALDEVQAAVVADVSRAGARAANLLVLGAPGTGKTTVALESAVGAVEAGLPAGRVLVLASSRRAAADLRDRVAARLPTLDRPAVRTAAALAWSVLRLRATNLAQPAPLLVSGAEQDRVLAELLAGHRLGEGAAPAWPPSVPAQAQTLRAFRDELRDLLMRAAERGLDQAALAELGRRHDRPEWVAAAAVYAEYLDVLVLGSQTPDAGARLDPAVVVDEAVDALLGWEADLPGLERPTWSLVVVDDHQESTAATSRLLRVLADDGARLLLLGDPDAATQTFRGAAPALVTRAGVTGDGPGEFGARTLVLPHTWRHGPVLRSTILQVTSRIGTSGSAAHRSAGPGRPSASSSEDPAGAARRVGDAGASEGRGMLPHAGDESSPAVRAAVLPSGAQEGAFVAHAVRSAHLLRGVPWDRIAVLARTGAAVTSLRRALAAAGVPVSVAGSDLPLRDEPAVRPLLDLLSVAGGRALDADLVAALAAGPIGGLDAVGLRRVRRELRRVELSAGGGRSSDELLVEAVDGPPVLAVLPSALARPVEHLARVVRAGREAAARPGADAQGVLWAIWAATGLAEPWRRAALAGGAAGERADRDLDAVVALFRAAESFVDRMPQAPPAAFGDWIGAQDLPSDTLAAGAAAVGVAVLTPAGAAGREWDLVVVAGVQESVWPDLRLRDSLLGSQALVELLAGRAPRGADSVTASRAAVLTDELRTFAVACSRARDELLVTAVLDEDQRPSPFLDLVDPPTGEVDHRLTRAPAPLDLRGLVAGLRSRLEASCASGAADAEAAGTLARLAAAGVPGADPTQWAGLAAPSTDAPLWGPDEQVAVSPSRLESVQRCALRWALESAGGTAGESGQQSLGTLVHAIAQELPAGSREELMASLDRHWPELGLGTGWPALHQRRRAEAMIGRLAQYLRTTTPAVLVEADFRFETPRAVVRGQIDRVEQAGDGRVVVVDLKTGSTLPPTADAEVNPQLAAYQLAVESGAVAQLEPGVTSAGARLVYVSQGAQAAQRTQPALSASQDPGWAAAMVDQVATTMAASAFAATTNALCERCPVRRSCPARPEGAQVTA